MDNFFLDILKALITVLVKFVLEKMLTSIFKDNKKSKNQKKKKHR